MALIRRIVTPRMAAANRRNSLFSTGPRTARGLAQSSLNALRHGRRSAILKDYSRLWLQAVFVDPRAAGPCLNLSQLPVPCSPIRPRDRDWPEYMQENVCAYAPFVRPWPCAVSEEAISRHDLSGAMTAEGAKHARKKNVYFGRSKP